MIKRGRWGVGRTPTNNPLGRVKTVEVGLSAEEVARRMERCEQCQVPRFRHELEGRLRPDHAFVPKSSG